MAATIHLNNQQLNPQHPQHQHVQQQSARNRPVSTPVPINYPGYPDIQHHPPPIPQSSVRRGNMFGPYLLLQTLGEGEFGKVKLGMHVDTNEEVRSLNLLIFDCQIMKFSQEVKLSLNMISFSR